MKKIIIVLIIISGLSYNCKKKSNITTNNNINQKIETWQSIFNGKDLSDWIVKINGYPVNENAFNTFRVENGVLKVSYDQYDNFGKSYGHIFYKKPLSNYKLRLQYRFVGKQATGGQAWAKKNSGIMLHAQSPQSMGLHQEFPVSLEAQFLGGVKENIARPTGNLCTPGTHVNLIDSLVTKHCIEAKAPTFYNNEWVNIEVTVLNDSLISHTVNGKEVIKYSKPIYGGEFLPETPKWKAKIGKPVKQGYIALQSESHPIEFKNIEILEFN